MLVVLSAAVRFHAKPAAECALRTVPRLAPRTKALVGELRQMESKDIQKQLHVNDALAKEYARHLGDFEASQPQPAAALYDAPLFNALHASDFDEDDADWANRYVRIFSGLYGLVRPFDELQPLSLPVTLSTKLTTTKGKFLRDFWREAVQKEMEDALQRLPMPVMLNLAAPEDMEVIDRDLLPDKTRIATVDFKLTDKSQIAEAKGEFLRWVLQNRVMMVEELLDFKGLVEEGEDATFRLSPKGSTVDHIVFEERINDGGASNWGKRLAEFGGSKRAFVKEFASGKDKYKRTEMNKAMVKENKDIKKKRAANAVY